jgi:hypothetical protein
VGDKRPGSAWTAGERFPTLAAQDLERTRRSLPEAFSGKWNLVVLAFRRQQQSQVDQWVRWHETLVHDHPGFECFEVPVLGAIWSPARSFIDGGMAQAVREVHARQHTLTVYTNVAKVTYALDIIDTNTVTVLLIDEAGLIHWRTTGLPDGIATSAVHTIIEG